MNKRKAFKRKIFVRFEAKKCLYLKLIFDRIKVSSQRNKECVILEVIR